MPFSHISKFFSGRHFPFEHQRPSSFALVFDLLFYSLIHNDFQSFWLEAIPLIVMYSQQLAGAFALSCFFMTVTPSINHNVADRIPMGGAVLYSRQGSDCPDYSDCNCEDWGMSCDLETYDWYDCSEVDLAGPGDCGAAAASSTGSIGLSSTAAPTSTVLPSTSVLPTTSAPATTGHQSFTTRLGGVTNQPGDRTNTAVAETAP